MVHYGLNKIKLGLWWTVQKVHLYFTNLLNLVAMALALASRTTPSLWPWLWP